MKKYLVSFTENQNVLNGQNFIIGNKWIHSNETFIVLDSSKAITIRGKFRSVGKVDSKVYFAVLPKTNKKMKVHRWEGENKTYSSYDSDDLAVDNILRKSNYEFTILSIESNGFVVKEDATKINLNGLYYEKSLFIFIDGDTSKLPDHILIYRVQNMLKSEDIGVIKRTSDRFISLNVNLDQTNLINDIKPRVTKIMQSTSSSTWVYCCNDLRGGVPSRSELKVYEGLVQGECEIGKIDYRKLPKFTTKVKVTIGFNYQQNDDAICLFDRIEIEGEGISRDDDTILNENGILIPENNEQLIDE